MGRIEELVEQTDGIAELVGLRSAWPAAAVVTHRFGTGGPTGGAQPLQHVVNWFRLTFLTRAITNRERTAVVGVGGPRLGPLVLVGLVSAWVAPRLPKVAVAAAAGLAVVAALDRGRLARLVWTSWVLRRDAPGAVLIGEFASREPGAGVAFATAILDRIGGRVTLALTVQGPPEDRRLRSLVRLYERRLGFAVVARRPMGDTSVVVMVRAAIGRPAPVPAAA